ncbi:hypothetical protein F53441_7356 [Fusarium austroafricanum]|uniref:Lysine-specific metallo-endopeptidase domain-containing protein n=1 Tax=Fusarium austroafricanum TaxID=2364996 RepID=A0A8H4KDU6_9HYPO|nr:hypothetical protein F53441_7356 [Fusarium austroafricanum]
MRIPLPFLLLTGFGLAADLSVWDWDESCQTSERVDAFQKAYNDAEILAVKAQQDLDFIRGARPDFMSDMRTNWDRISRAVTNMFGFVPNRAGHDPNEEHYANVRYVFDRMVRTLHDGQMVPEKGYSGFKPLLVCDESQFVWVGRDDKDPHDPAGRPLRESRSHEIGDTTDGAWVYKNRYLVNSNKQNTPGICRPGTFAVTLTRYDFVIFCPPSFTANVAQTKSAVDAKDSISEGNTLDSFSMTSLPRVMVHEFAHFFGGDGTGGPENRNVGDQRAVGARGDFVYLTPDNKLTIDANIPGVKPCVTYNYRMCSNLARIHQGPNGANTGPGKSTFSAEPYAIFSLMAYMDNWDWANDGKAKAFKEEMIPYKSLPNSKKARLG